jgi:hypothetical protein
MSFVNLASATKLNRSQTIIAAIGTNGFMQLYTGTVPASPDLPATGVLVASLPLAAIAGVASLVVQQAIITAPGATGVDGSYFLTITDDIGTGAAGYFIVVAGILDQIIITDYGESYTDSPTISGFETAGLTGAIALPVMTARITVNPITSAFASNDGTVGWARVATAAGVGVIDLDVGMTNDFSVVMNNTAVMAGNLVGCSAELLIEV